jgi:hypothetical protein
MCKHQIVVILTCTDIFQKVQGTTKEEFVAMQFKLKCNAAIYTLLIMQHGLQMQQLLTELNMRL